MNNNNIFDMTSLSEASYVDWTGVDFSNSGEIIGALIDTQKNGKFAFSQATYFSAHWEVIAN